MKKKNLWMLAAILTCGLMLASCAKEDAAAVAPVPSEMQQNTNEFETDVPAISGDAKVIAALKQIPGVTDIKCFEHESEDTMYYFNFEQDIDHRNPALGKFKQQVVLLYKGKDHNNVLYTEGYALGGDPEVNYNRLDSLVLPAIVDMYETNYVGVEHRYHGWSLPQGFTNDFTYLSTWQQSTDLHCIVTALKASGLFAGKWVSTGVSKCGETTAYYAYHYPNEMDAYVPYCGPYLTSLADQRVGDFVLEPTSIKADIEKVKTAYSYALNNKPLMDQLLSLLVKTYGEEAGKTREDQTASLVSTLIGNLFSKESLVHISLWRDWIPTEKSSAEEFMKFLMADENTKYKNESQQEIAARHRMKMRDMGLQPTFGQLSRRAAPIAKYGNRFKPYNVQKCIDLGDYVYSYAWFEDLLGAEKVKMLKDATIESPDNYGVTYDNGKFVKEFLEGMKTTPCKILFVFGGSDPWTGGAISDDIVSANANISKLIVFEGVHTDVTTHWNKEDIQTLKKFLDPYLKKQ